MHPGTYKNIHQENARAFERKLFTHKGPDCKSELNVFSSNNKNRAHQVFNMVRFSAKFHVSLPALWIEMSHPGPAADKVWFGDK